MVLLKGCQFELFVRDLLRQLSADVLLHAFDLKGSVLSQLLLFGQEQ
jgi:hypothetical protein